MVLGSSHESVLLKFDNLPFRLAPHSKWQAFKKLWGLPLGTKFFVDKLKAS
jgi:hypothetical protein